ncbi:hypothetical protein DER46DRAFT_680711 [Fusarium sp. MPI-SDFR-AT-0072]|nr:hypothetical protein DER46DRAFT_680711 [Fusarium sp. MPI-SDFR-AT-0072]
MRRYFGRKGFISNEYSGQNADDIPGKETSPYATNIPKESPVSLSTNACLSMILRLNEPAYIKSPNIHVGSGIQHSASPLFSKVASQGQITLLTPSTSIPCSLGSSFDDRPELFLRKLGAYHPIDKDDAPGTSRAQRPSKSPELSDNAPEDTQDELWIPVLEESKEQHAESGPPKSCDYVPPQDSGGNREASSFANPNRDEPDNPDDGNYDMKEDSILQPQIPKLLQTWASESEWGMCQHPVLESFEKKDRLEAHASQPAFCIFKDMSPSERFMSPEDETAVGRLGCFGSPEEAWWKMFQLLIPGAQNPDLEVLKIQYCSYYVYTDSFDIPCLSFSEVSFELGQSGVPASTVEEGPTIENGVPRTAMPDMNQGSFSYSIPPYLAHLPLLGSTITQEFQPDGHYVQKSASSSRHQLQSLALGSPTPTQTRYPSQGSEPVNSSREQRLLRHIQILREKYLDAETKITFLQETTRNTVSQVGRADEVIENHLASDKSLPDHVYESLFEDSTILSNVRRGMR